MVSYQPKLQMQAKPGLLEKTIAQIYTSKFDYLTPDMPMSMAIEKIKNSELNGLPVLGFGKKPLGFLSEKDCLRVAVESRYLNNESGHVSDYMIHNCQTLPLETPIFQAVDAFLSIWYHSYPVVDNTGSVIGVLKRKAVLGEISKMSRTSW